jgi:predicted amidophosphoribosyltransferase
MTAKQRTHNLKGAFTVSEPCDNLRIAIVDDVFTTGATASAVAEALATAGAGYIEVWCLARTPAPGD